MICSFVMDAKPGTRKKGMFAALFFLVIGFPPLVNSFDNPRLAGLHGPDVPVT